MNSKKIGLLIFVLIVSMIPEAGALTPQSQTAKIIDTHDDMFITETGIGIDSSLVTIKDPNMDLRAFLVFRDIKINYWEPLKNATLRLRTASTLPSDPDSSVTFYGMKISELQDSLPLSVGNVLSIGFTEAYTNYNTSEFSGQTYHEIDVTDIVEELIRNPHWDGDGIAGTETGDAIGFHILGAEGDDKRYFHDLSGDLGYEAQLVIHWNHEPPPPSGLPDGATYNSTHRDYEIWVKSTSLRIDASYWDGSKEQYLEINTNSSDVEIPGVSSPGNRPSSYQIIRGPKDDIFYMGRVGGNQTLFHSYDEGETWDNYTLNNLYSDLNNRLNTDGSLAMDSAGDLWIVWASKSDYIVSNYYWIVSTNVTITDHVLVFNDEVEYNIANRPGYLDRDQRRPCLWIDGNDRKHLIHDGPYPNANDAQIYYTYKDDGAWTGRVILTNFASGRDYQYGNIVTSNNGTFKTVTWYSDVTEVSLKYFKTEWLNKGVGPGGSGDKGGHLSYNDNNDKVLFIWDISGHIYSQIFNFTDESVTAYAFTGAHGQFGDLCFDVSSNEVLMIYDGGEDGLNGSVFSWDTETWNTTFKIRDVDPGYSHIASLGKIDLGGTGEGDADYYAVDENGTITGPFDTLPDVIDWIDTEDDDPEDPAPPGWDETGPFTRFKTRLYILLLGIALIFGPVMYFAYSRPSGYEFVIGLFIMLIGFALMIASGSV